MQDAARQCTPPASQVNRYRPRLFGSGGSVEITLGVRAVRFEVVLSVDPVFAIGSVEMPAAQRVVLARGARCNPT